MKTRLIILTLAAAILSSCSHYKLKSAQNEDHACYSTWHKHPHNS